MTNKGSCGSNPSQPLLELNESETEQPFPKIWGPQPDQEILGPPSGQEILGQRFFRQGEDNQTWVPGTQPLPISNPRNMLPNYENRSLPIMRQQLPPQGEMRHEYSLWGQNPSSQGPLTEQQIHFGTSISTDQTQQQTTHNFQTQYQNQLIESYKEFGAQFTNPRQQNSLSGVGTEMTAIQDDKMKKLAKFTTADQNSQPIITGAISTQGKEDCKTKTYPIGTNRNLLTRNPEWGQNPGPFGTEVSQNPVQSGFSPNQGQFGPSQNLGNFVALQNPGQFEPSQNQGQLKSVPKTGNFGSPQTPGPSSSKHQKSDLKTLKKWSLWHMPPSKNRPWIFQKGIKNYPDVDNALQNYKDGPLLDGESYYFIPIEIDPSKVEELVQNRLVCFVKPIPTDRETSPTFSDDDDDFLGVQWNFLIKTLIDVKYDESEDAAIYREIIIGAVMERQKTSDRSWNQRICVLLSAHSREILGTFVIYYFRGLLARVFENERIFYDGDAHPNPPSHP